MFYNRNEAGEQLVEKLLKYKNKSPLVLALPRGGVVVGFPIAKALQAPLDVIIARKIGAPQNLELGIGAVAEDNAVIWDNTIIDYFQISQSTLHLLEARETLELERRKRLYRQGRPLPLLTNKTVILVDDGLATGVTARAALLALKKHHPKQIIFAAPLCVAETAFSMNSVVDKIICLQTPKELTTIGSYYQDFHQVTDKEVTTLLRKIKDGQKVIRWGDGDFGHKIVW